MEAGSQGGPEIGICRSIDPRPMVGRTPLGRARTLISSVPLLGSPPSLPDALGGPERSVGKVSERSPHVWSRFVVFLVCFSEGRGGDGGDGSAPGPARRGAAAPEFQASELDLVLLPFAKTWILTCLPYAATEPRKPTPETLTQPAWRMAQPPDFLLIFFYFFCRAVRSLVGGGRGPVGYQSCSFCCERPKHAQDRPAWSLALTIYIFGGG